MNREKAKLLYAEPLPENMTQEEYDSLSDDNREDDERLNFRVIMMILEAKRPNATSWDTLLTREAMQEMVDFEEFLYGLKLPYDH